VALLPTAEREKVSAKGKSEYLPAASGQGRWFLRTACVAVALFVATNAVLFLFVGEAKKSKDFWSGTGAIDTLVGDYAALKKGPDIVLLGSSLMMYPFWAMDKNANDRIGDIFHHHDSLTLRKALVDAGLKPSSIYNFATFGTMISDSYIFLNEFCSGDKKPDTVVLGFAPRDFSDSDVLSPMATMSFNTLINLSNFAPYAALYLPGFQEKADFVFSHVCWFYARRGKLQREFEKGINKLYAFLGVVEQIKQQQKSGFMLDGNADERWIASTNEYKRRYRDIESKSIDVQLGFLRKMITVCKERGIRIILVNMPLHQTNRDLLPAGYYTKYRTAIADVAAAENVKFLDLGESPEFVQSDYWDTSHLNHSGGYKLLPHITSALK
jgi:hypothetical protein